jgi:hypothetical protein
MPDVYEYLEELGLLEDFMVRLDYLTSREAAGQ